MPLVKHRVGETLDETEVRRLAQEMSIARASHFLGVHWETVQRFAAQRGIRFQRRYSLRLAGHPLMPRCRYCETDIDFIPLENGKKMPVESSEPETYYLHVGKPGAPRAMIVTPSGTIISGRLGKAHESGVTKVEGCESHFASCPGAAQARKP